MRSMPWIGAEGGFPLKLKYDFEIIELDDRMVAVPVGENVSEFRGVIKMNTTAARIFELLKDDTTEDAIIDTLSAEYEAPREVVSTDVQRYIWDFQSKGLLE